MYENSFLLKCPDEILLAILKHLFPEDLMNLSLGCHKLAQIVEDHTLWDKVKISLNTIINFSRPSLLFRTKHLTINGNRCYDHVHDRTINYIEKTLISLTNLEELTLEDFYITQKTILHIASINIKKLTLNRCTKAKNTFYFCHKHCIIMSNLTCLILNNMLCPITPKFLSYLINLLPNLTELRINSCVYRNSFQFLNEERDNWEKFALFKNLEILDLQNTILEDLSIEWFSRNKNLKQLYLEKPKYLNLRRNLIIYASSLWCPEWDNSFELIDAINELRDDRTQYSLLRVGECITKNCNNLEIVAIRNYDNISIESINLILSLPKLRILDVTGICSISKQDIERFKLRKQDVKVISSFDTL